MATTVYGLSAESFERTKEAVRLVLGGVQQQRVRSKYPIVTLSSVVAVIGCATEDWTAFGTVEVEIRTSSGMTGETIDCRAPGTDGTSMTGTQGICIPITGFDVGYQFIPLECEPTCS